jgi:hypothetical protein
MKVTYKMLAGQVYNSVKNWNKKLGTVGSPHGTNSPWNGVVGSPHGTVSNSAGVNETKSIASHTPDKNMSVPKQQANQGHNNGGA